MLVTQRMRGLFSLFTIFQVGLAGTLFWLHYWVISEFYRDIPLPDRYTGYFILAMGGLLMEALLRYFNETRILHLAFAQAHRIAIRQAITVGALGIIFLVAKKEFAISRLFLSTYVVLVYVVQVWACVFIPPLLARWAFRKSAQENTLLMGSPRRLEALHSWLELKRTLGINPVGLLTTQLDSQASLVPVLGKPEDLEQVVRKHKVTQLILLEFPAMTEALRTIMGLCENLGIRLVVVSDLEEKFHHPIIYKNDDGVALLGVRDEVLENPLNRVLKRAFDLAMALPVVVLVLPPVCVLVWFLHRLHSPGPLFYRQTRAGLMNHTFSIWKFRTMHVDNPSEGRQASAGDARVFPSGRWLRKFSVDELPQFLNAIDGSMSVVGPRPHLPEHNEQFASALSNYHIRAFIKPGITGLAQVRGFRGETKTEEQIRRRILSDIDYLENWSLAMDLNIVLRTTWQMFRPPPSAY
ncbi:MAG: exopolysaccharide biosynthesis polyprenyl glycosylphosphotransferase [Verrucomicrobiota bacterium]